MVKEFENVGEIIRYSTMQDYKNKRKMMVWIAGYMCPKDFF